MARFVRRKKKKKFPAKPAFPSTHVKLKSRPSVFQRHKRLVTIIGALVVFITFVIKEGFQQRLREEIDDLKAARQSLTIVKEALRSEDINMLEGVDVPSRVTESQAEELQVRMSQRFNKLLEIRKREEATKEAIRELPLRSVEFDRARLAIKEVEDAESGKRNYPVTSSDLKGVLANLRVLSKEEGYISLAQMMILQNADAMDIAVRSEEVKLSRQYSIAEYVGYLLFAVGWAIAIFGKAAMPELSEE